MRLSRREKALRDYPFSRFWRDETRARLWQQGLSWRAVASKLGIPVTTAVDAFNGVFENCPGAGHGGGGEKLVLTVG